MSVEIFEQHAPSSEFIAQGPISLVDLLGGRLPDQGFHLYEDRPEEEAFYPELAVQPLVPLVRDQAGRKDFFIVCPALRGKQLLFTSSYAGPSKVYDADFEDLDDWDGLYTDPTNIDRLERHRKLPGWKKYFEPHRAAALDFINRDYNEESFENDLVVPVIHIVQEGNNLSWNLDPLSYEDEEHIATHTANPKVSSVKYRPVFGPLFVAAFSRDKTSAWGKRLNYQLRKHATAGNDMGSTQAFALSIALKDTLLDSRVVSQLLQYAVTGEVPTYVDEVVFSGITPDELRQIGLPNYALQSVRVSSRGVQNYSVDHRNDELDGPFIYVTRHSQNSRSLETTAYTVAKAVGGRVINNLGNKELIEVMTSFTPGQIADFLSRYTPIFGNMEIDDVVYRHVPTTDLYLAGDVPYMIYTPSAIDIE